MAYTAQLSFLRPPAPPLPPFQTLLIQGNYPASSPFHLCLSHLSCTHGSESRPILVTARNKTRLTKSLVELNDHWLVDNSGRGITADLLSRIQIFYPSTPDHWAFLFSLLRTDVPSEFGSVPTNLGQPVSLLVLHEPSAYFLDCDPPKSWQLHNELLLALDHVRPRVIAFIEYGLRTTSPPPLVVFDSRLQELSLPVLPAAITDPIVEEETEEFGPGRRRHKVGLAAERYFDLIGRVEVVPDEPSKPHEEHANSMQFRMLLSSSEYSSFSLPSPLVWRWRNVWVKGTDASEPRTVFHWNVM